MKHIRRKYFPKSKKEYDRQPVEVDHYYTVVAPNGGYFVKRTRSGYRYSPSFPSRKFFTEKEAQKYANKMKRHITLTVQRIDHSARLFVPVPRIIAEIA